MIDKYQEVKNLVIQAAELMALVALEEEKAVEDGPDTIIFLIEMMEVSLERVKNEY